MSDKNQGDNIDKKSKKRQIEAQIVLSEDEALVAETNAKKPSSVSMVAKAMRAKHKGPAKDVPVKPQTGGDKQSLQKNTKNLLSTLNRLMNSTSRQNQRAIARKIFRFLNKKSPWVGEIHHDMRFQFREIVKRTAKFSWTNTDDFFFTRHFSRMEELFDKLDGTERKDTWSDLDQDSDRDDSPPDEHPGKPPLGRRSPDSDGDIGGGGESAGAAFTPVKPAACRMIVV
jgi:hypothetical protein